MVVFSVNVNDGMAKSFFGKYWQKVFLPVCQYHALLLRSVLNLLMWINNADLEHHLSLHYEHSLMNHLVLFNFCILRQSFSVEEL